VIIAVVVLSLTPVAIHYFRGRAKSRPDAVGQHRSSGERDAA
jgi:hypothetical protein